MSEVTCLIKLRTLDRKKARADTGGQLRFAIPHLSLEAEASLALAISCFLLQLLSKENPV